MCQFLVIAPRRRWPCDIEATPMSYTWEAPLLVLLFRSLGDLILACLFGVILGCLTSDARRLEA